MKLLKKCLTALLCLSLCLSAVLFVGCPAPTGVPVMEYESLVLTDDIYRFWLCCYRAQFSHLETDENRAQLATLADMNIRKSLVAAAAFDAFDLRLDTTARNQIDGAMRTLEEVYGSRKALDEALAVYGIGYDGLRRAISYEQKALALANYLFGDGGIYEPTKEEREDYYEELYCRVQVITVLYVDFVLDANGERIFDRATGQYLYERKTGDALAAKEAKAAELASKLYDGIAEIPFQQLLAAYNEDSAAKEYPSGYYFAKGGDYREYIEEIPEAALSMDEGTVVRVESEYGVHFLLRVPLDEGAYDAEENRDFFEDFYPRMQSYFFELYVTQLVPNVTVHYDVQSSIRYEDCEPNFEIYW